MFKAYNFVTAQKSYLAPKARKIFCSLSDLCVLIAVNHSKCELLQFVLQGPMLFISAVYVCNHTKVQVLQKPPSRRVLKSELLRAMLVLLKLYLKRYLSVFLL